MILVVCVVVFVENEKDVGIMKWDLFFLFNNKGNEVVMKLNWKFILE